MNLINRISSTSQHSTAHVHASFSRSESARCMLHVVCCIWHAASCMLHVACRTLDVVRCRSYAGCWIWKCCTARRSSQGASCHGDFRLIAVSPARLHCSAPHRAALVTMATITAARVLNPNRKRLRVECEVLRARPPALRPSRELETGLAGGFQFNCYSAEIEQPRALTHRCSAA